MQLLVNKGDFEILAYTQTVDTSKEPIDVVKKAGTTCYQSEQRTTKDGKEFAQMLRNRKHWSMFDHVSATVWFKNVSRGFCYDDQTEVLTKEGGKLFKNTTEEDEFFTFNTSTLDNEYQKRTNVTIENWDGELIYGSNKKVDFAVTPNHTMIHGSYYLKKNKTWKKSFAKDIYNKNTKFLKGLPSKWEGYTRKPFITLGKKLYDLNLFLELYGIWWADGTLVFDHRRNKQGNVSIHQRKTKIRKRIKHLLKELDINYYEDGYNIKWFETSLFRFFSRYYPKGGKSLKGHVPKFIKTLPPEYIKSFILGVIKGDGHIRQDSDTITIYSSSKDLIDDLQELVLKTGWYSSYSIVDRVGNSHFIDKNRKITTKNLSYNLYISTKTPEVRFQKGSWEKKYYKGKVYCVTIPNGPLYVRRNGKPFWSHNTHELVRHRLCAFAQESTRYVDPTNDPLTGKPGNLDLKVVAPPCRDTNEKYIVTDRPSQQDSQNKGLKNNELQHDHNELSFADMAEIVEQFYKVLRHNGWVQEDARQILPIGTKSDIVMTADITEWRHVFMLRTAKAAHWEIRSVMCKLLEEFRELFTPVFDDFVADGKDKNGIPYYKIKGYVGDIPKMLKKFRDDFYIEEDNIMGDDSADEFMNYAIERYLNEY